MPELPFRNAARLVRNFASPNPDRRLAALNILGQWLMGDYRLSWQHMDWWRDADFNAYLERFGERGGFNTHRRWMLWQLLRMVGDLDGDTAECGVFEGASSWLICAANRQSRPGRKHHLFDSFEGLSRPDEKDGSYWEPGALARSEAIVESKLAPFLDDLVFHKGWIPERFGDVSDRAFAFVHVDVDLRQPTLDSIIFFYDRLVPGGILLCDDYGCTSCPGATSALDEFLADKPEKMIALDAGGGFFVKGRATTAPLSTLASIGG